MFVKEYLKLITAINHQTNIHDLHNLFMASEDYLKKNPKLNNAAEEFERKLKQNVCDAVFSFFPELKPRETTLRKELGNIVDENSPEIFSAVFEIVLDYLENPDRFDHNKKWNWRILTEEQMLEEAIEETKHLSGENREVSIKSRMNTRKVMNHFYYFNVVLHKVILSCISSIFLEVPLLSGNGIRYLDYSMAREAYILKDKMIGLFNKDLQEPEFD